MTCFPFFASWMQIPLRVYALVMVVDSLHGAAFALWLAPAWAAQGLGRLLMFVAIAYTASVGIFASLDQTSREWLQKVRAHERGRGRDRGRVRATVRVT